MLWLTYNLYCTCFKPGMIWQTVKSEYLSNISISISIFCNEHITFYFRQFWNSLCPIHSYLYVYLLSNIVWCSSIHSPAPRCFPQPHEKEHLSHQNRMETQTETPVLYRQSKSLLTHVRCMMAVNKELLWDWLTGYLEAEFSLLWRIMCIFSQ